uniref:peptidylprolyl isomerase n=1 Tax=Diabrotica virgifera virgifera TaxID=50390 RepID=A0A6P7G9L9_DIAVI
MFWGLIMEPQRRYLHVVKKAFHISMASLDVGTSSDEPAQVMCSFEGRNYLLCTLSKTVLQCPLDLNFEVGVYIQIVNTPLETNLMIIYLQFEEAPFFHALLQDDLLELIQQQDEKTKKKVYYEGRLKNNNKMFDSHKQGQGFAFKLGSGEVIKGWDVGLVGMKVGGKRRITCPPQMAYGVKGSPPAIPGNSTLVFEVELKKIR